MALHARLEKIDELPDAIREHYRQADDGSFVLDVAPVDGWALEDVQGLRNALQGERTKGKEARTALESFGDLDPEAARAALSKVAEMADWKPDDKVREQIEADRRALTDKHAAELAKREKALAEATGEIERLTIDAQAMAALGEHGGAKSAAMLLPYIKGRCRLDRENGQYRVSVLDDDGNERVSLRQGQTGPMGLDEFVETLRDSEAFAPAFAGSGASGSGATSDTGGGPGRLGSHTISAADARDPAKYRAARSAAQEAGSDLTITD